MMMHKMGQTPDVNIAKMGMMMKKKFNVVHMGMGMMKKKFAHMGMMMGMMLVGRVHAIKKMNKGSWVLVKNKSGSCECKRGNVKKGKVILGRFHSIKDCETHRTHDC